MINKHILLGFLGADPETRTTSNGTVVTKLRVATTHRRKDGDRWVDETTWSSVVTFGKTAEFMARNASKGRQVYVEGRVNHRKWQDKEGVDRYTTETIGEEVKLLGPKGAEKRDDDHEQQGSADDDLPF